MKLSASLLVALIAFAAQAQKIDLQASEVAFSISNMKLNTVEGSFGNFSGEGILDSEKPKSSKLSLCVAVASINTAIDKRDEHLKQAEFFHAEQYPLICFESEQMSYDVASKNWQVSGNLRIKDQAQKLKVVLYPTEKGYQTQFKIKRLDFKVGEDFSTFLAGNEVEIKVLLATP